MFAMSRDGTTRGESGSCLGPIHSKSITGYLRASIILSYLRRYFRTFVPSFRTKVVVLYESTSVLPYSIDSLSKDYIRVQLYTYVVHVLYGFINYQRCIGYRCTEVLPEIEYFSEFLTYQRRDRGEASLHQLIGVG